MAGVIDMGRTIQTLYAFRPDAGPMDTQGWYWGLADAEHPWVMRMLYLQCAIAEIMGMAGEEARDLVWGVDTPGHPILIDVEE